MSFHHNPIRMSKVEMIEWYKERIVKYNFDKVLNELTQTVEPWYPEVKEYCGCRIKLAYPAYIDENMVELFGGHGGHGGHGLETCEQLECSQCYFCQMCRGDIIYYRNKD